MAKSLTARVAAAQFPLSGAAEREIQKRVWDYADTLKEAGFPPERVIVAVKRVAGDAGVHPTSRVTAMPTELDGRDKLLADMVNWCIERYYDHSDAAD
jgi:hypothetical protein